MQCFILSHDTARSILLLEEKGEEKGPYWVMQHLGSMPYSKLAAAEEA